MWIRRIEVRHCAGIAEGAVDLQRGFNVLHGPNELGKSTLVAALRAAFLLPATSSLASSLQDCNVQEPPEVSVTFEDDDARVWRIRKIFPAVAEGRSWTFPATRSTSTPMRGAARSTASAAGRDLALGHQAVRPQGRRRAAVVPHHHGAADRSKQCRSYSRSKPRRRRR